MPTLHVLCGPPGAGKTTLSKQLTEQYNAKLVCFDELPGAFSVSRHKQVRREMHEGLANDLSYYDHVVCDDVNTKLETRLDILAGLSDVDCKKILYVMTTDLEECLRRNRERDRTLPDQVVINIFRSYEHPTLHEGWDEIIYIE